MPVHLYQDTEIIRGRLWFTSFLDGARGILHFGFLFKKLWTHNWKDSNWLFNRRWETSNRGGKLIKWVFCRRCREEDQAYFFTKYVAGSYFNVFNALAAMRGRIDILWFLLIKCCLNEIFLFSFSSRFHYNSFQPKYCLQPVCARIYCQVVQLRNWEKFFIGVSSTITVSILQLDF